MKVRVAIIGGSGLYKLLEKAEHVILDTPFGKTPRIDIGYFGGVRVAFLARHAMPGSMKVAHEVPPHRINFRANIYGLKKLGAEAIIATSACGSLRRELEPGDFVIIDQFIDMTKSRTYTFYDGTTTPKELLGVDKEDLVVHIDVTEPYCPTLRRILIEACKKVGVKYHERGCYVCTEGPRFETPAEIRFFSAIGADVVGMTNVPEVILARELNIHYATIAVVTNYAAGLQRKVTQEEVIEIFNRSMKKLVKVLEEAVRNIPGKFTCECDKAVH